MGTIRILDGFVGSRQIAVPTFMQAWMDNDNIGRELYITDIGHYTRAEHHYCKRAKGCAEFVFIYCVEGQGWYTLNGQKHKVRKNQFFIVPMKEAHSYGAADVNPWTIYWIHFRGARAAEIAMPLANGLHAIDIADDSRIEDRISLFEEIYATLDHGITAENMLYASLVLYHLLGTLLFIKQFREAKNRGRMHSEVLETIIHYMRENIEKDISISELISISGYATWQFNKIFKQQTGCSPKRYYLQFKIREACRYLCFSNMKVNQVCSKVGFTDPMYFTRMFRKEMGCSPSMYRKRNNQTKN